VWLFARCPHCQELITLGSMIELGMNSGIGQKRKRLQ
jgi:hypothetical protein